MKRMYLEFFFRFEKNKYSFFCFIFWIVCNPYFYCFVYDGITIWICSIESTYRVLVIPTNSFECIWKCWKITLIRVMIRWDNNFVFFQLTCNFKFQMLISILPTFSVYRWIAEKFWLLKVDMCAQNVADCTNTKSLFIRISNTNVESKNNSSVIFVTSSSLGRII